jgi:hypothetical protein
MSHSPPIQQIRSAFKAMRITAAAVARRVRDGLVVPEGYEDDSGFHFGPSKRQEMAATAGQADFLVWSGPGGAEPVRLGVDAVRVIRKRISADESLRLLNTDRGFALMASGESSDPSS